MTELEQVWCLAAAAWLGFALNAAVMVLGCRAIARVLRDHLREWEAVERRRDEGDWWKGE